MLILESRLFDPTAGWDLRVYGSDISKKCVAAARRGVYGPASFRATTEEARAKWFAPHGAEASEPALGPGGPARAASGQAGQAGRVGALGHYGVAPAARTLCHFTQMNLLDEERTQLVGDATPSSVGTWCIYFDAAARRRASRCSTNVWTPAAYSCWATPSRC